MINIGPASLSTASKTHPLEKIILVGNFVDATKICRAQDEFLSDTSFSAVACCVVTLLGGGNE
jgi:hypothetical protein